MRAIIDYDSGVYAMASACDGRKWWYKGRSWDLKKIAVKALVAEGKDPNLLELRKDPEPWGKVKKTVDRYTDTFIEKLDDQFNYEFYIKGGGNFRYPLATILPYKDGRDEEPEHRQSISDYLVDSYGAKRVYNVEVDDAIGIIATESVVMVHIDKDLNQFPGIHYNPQKEVTYEVSEIEGLRSVYKQVLTGDATDAILGLFGVGDKSTHVKKLQLMQTEEEIYDHVYKLYEQRFGTYSPLFLRENMRLAWLMRGDKREYYWMNQLLNEEDIAFYMNPWDTMEVK